MLSITMVRIIPRLKKNLGNKFAPKSLFSSQSSTEHMVLNSQEDNGDKRESQDFDVAVNLRKSHQQMRRGISVVSNEDHESSPVSGYSAQEDIIQASLRKCPLLKERRFLLSIPHQQDFRGNDFYRAIRTLLERAKSYPLLARERGMEGTVFVSFVIGSRGLPQDVKIMKSSGYQILDEEVKKMLKKASPFPGIKGEIVIPITFKLTDSISNR